MEEKSLKITFLSIKIHNSFRTSIQNLGFSEYETNNRSKAVDAQKSSPIQDCETHNIFVVRILT
jgi:hypothetical protein